MTSRTAVWSSPSSTTGGGSESTRPVRRAALGIASCALCASLAAGALTAGGCADADAARDAPGRAGEVAASHEALTDRDYLMGPQWNDGMAEIAFYRVERQHNQYGQARPQSFLAGTYLVKHDFDREKQAKARRDEPGVAAFKWSAFYEFESDNSYQYKLSFVVNAAQATLMPFKASFSGFDWCSNQYREMSFLPSGELRRLYRSDDYGNEDITASLPLTEAGIPATLIPLWMRALDFDDVESSEFSVIRADGEMVSAQARLLGTEELAVAGASYVAERVELAYDGAAESVWGSRRRGADRTETYWRAKDATRLLLRMESESYRVELVEAVRSPYWSENVYDRLRLVDERP